MRHNIARLEIAGQALLWKADERFKALENIIFKNHKTLWHILYNIAVRTFSSVKKGIVGLCYRSI